MCYLRFLLSTTKHLVEHSFSHIIIFHNYFNLVINAMCIKSCVCKIFAHSLFREMIKEIFNSVFTCFTLQMKEVNLAFKFIGNIIGNYRVKVTLVMLFHQCFLFDVFFSMEPLKFSKKVFIICFMKFSIFYFSFKKSFVISKHLFCTLILNYSRCTM